VSEHPEDFPDDVSVPVVDDQPVEATGHADVDDVLASLADLEGRPVGEHVAVFEAAHDRLRGALADAGSDPSGS
jgi:hypothetical protein